MDMNTRYSSDEMMTIAAARMLVDHEVCFVGIGLPSAAANLARQTHAPKLKLIYESGTIETRPTVLPLSIGDSELAETATSIVSLPEIFSWWLQAGRIDVGFLGAAQIDRYGNLNSTVIGDYDAPETRLPGSGGAPEIALHAKKTWVILKQSVRTFVEKLDFCTSPGYLQGFGDRARRGLPGAGPECVITDKGILRPDPDTDEMILVEIYKNIDLADVISATGWPLKISEELTVVDEPSPAELHSLRALNERTRLAHSRPVKIPLAGYPV